MFELPDRLNQTQVMDGPEWGYEIAARHQDHRSYFFHDLPETLRDGECVA